MSDILETIQSLKGMCSLSPAKKTDVFLAESELDLHFAEDYKQYLLTYGLISAVGIEITGLIPSPRLNVVAVTRQEREMNPAMPVNMYVVEETGFEGLLILQEESGAVWSLTGNGKLKKEFDSLADYLLSRQADEV